MGTGPRAANDCYTPGHGTEALAYMGERRVATHAEFFLPELVRGESLLDCGCGPGTLTVDLAEAVAPGEVHAIDVSEEQFAIGRTVAAERGVAVSFQQGSVYELPFDDARFDAVFAHALLEHLADPRAAVREMARVLRPGGVLGVSSPDWGGSIVAPPHEQLEWALEAWRDLKRENGGEPEAGRHLPVWTAAAGLTDLRVGARYEVYEDPSQIGELLATRLHEAGRQTAASALRLWKSQRASIFAHAWVHVTGRRPRQH
jgi:SAM-dependent methyltransferase